MLFVLMGEVVHDDLACGGIFWGSVSKDFVACRESV